MPAITSTRLTAALVLGVLVFATGETALAQESSSNTPAIIKALNTPRSLDLDGIGSALVAGSRQAGGRQSDSVLNGALIGAGVAIAGGLFLCTRTEPWENCRDDVGPILRIGAIGAGIGIAVDALIRGQQTPFDPSRGSTRVRAMPLFGRGTRGAIVSVGF